MLKTKTNLKGSKIEEYQKNLQNLSHLIFSKTWFLSPSSTKAYTYSNVSEVEAEERKIVLKQHIWAVQLILRFLEFKKKRHSLVLLFFSNTIP